MSDLPPRQRAHCNECGGQRNHEQLFSCREEWEEEDEYEGEKFPGCHGWDAYTLLKCSGCDRVRLKHESWDEAEPVNAPIVTYYPPALSRNLPKWLNTMEGLQFYDLSKTFLPTLLQQIYSSYHSGGYALAAMGIRALVEQVMIDKIGDKRSFTLNLQALSDAGYISVIQREFLEKTIHLGHVAIHRGYQPTSEDIRRALDITEPILETIYIHEGHAEQLKKSTPERKKRS